MVTVYPRVVALASALALLPVGCAGPDPDSARPAATVPAAAPSGPLVVFLGDSLTAGYGLSEDQAYPAIVAARLQARGTQVRVVNAGVSGDTTAGGLARLGWILRQKPDVLVVALGGNDALRGQPPASAEANLRKIVVEARAAGSRVLLLGLKIPPSYGPEYARRFEAIYGNVASELRVPLLPFFLEGVGGVTDMTQPDGLHPNAKGQARAAENVLPWLEKELAAL